MEGIRGKILAVTIVVCSLWIGTFSFTLDAVANEDPMYELTVTVVSGHGTVEPNSGSYSAGTVVTLTATPEAVYNMRQWTGTDDDTSCELTNTVTMDSDKTVTVEFGMRHAFQVPGGYVSIQEAIDAAACGDIIVLNAGVHFGNINFNGKNIIVSSVYPDDPMCVAYTVIQGSGAGPVVTFSGSESQSCVLDGLTITGGNTTGDGGGICGNGTEAMIANCIITNNHADGYGGGVSDCNGTIVRCTITGNTAGGGGGMYNHGSSPVLTNCTFNENLAVDGGAIYIRGEFNGTLTDCAFENNTAAVYGGAISHTGFGELNIIRCEFRDGSAERGGAIYNIYAPLVLSRCILVGNQAEYAGAIDTDGDITLTNCLLANNQALVWGGALANMMNTSRSINCTFVGNSANYGGAIFSNIECDTTAINSIFWDNTAQTGSQIATSGSHGGSTLTVNYCDIENGLEGLYVPNGCTLFWGEGNIDADPYFVDPDGEDNVVGTEDDNLRLLLGSPCVDTGDNTALPPFVLTDLDGNPRITGDTVDMGAYEFQGLRTLYVDGDAPFGGDGKSWATAFRHLQDALFNASPGTEIRVAQGIYKPHLNSYSAQPPSRADTFQLMNGVTIKGGYAGLGQPEPNARDISLYETILSGDLNGNDIEVTDPADMWDDPSRSDNSLHVVTGSGTNATAVLDGFTITGGNANSTNPDHRGGGMFNRLDSSPTVTNCTFIANSATFRGGGMFNDDYSNPMVDNCTFTGNLAGRGGGMCNDEESTTTVINCIFSGNSAVYGGGMGNDEGCPIVINCTFVGNSANNGGGMEMSERGNAMITNCIFWANSPDQISLDYEEGATASVTYTDVQGGWEGLGNIDVDPLFADPCDGDYHLKSEGWRWSKYLVHGSHWWCNYVTSPCIDAGNPGSPLGDELLTIPDDPNHDWGENLRINMGAYGGTAQASMPPYGWALLGDLSNNGIIDYEDLAGQIEDWLTIANEKPGDLNRDGIVNMADFALLAQDWLVKTSWYPPIVLEIYSNGWGTLLDTITMRQEGEITISVEEENPYGDPPRYYIYASREGYSTELYYCEKGDTINVDLDEIIPDKFNGVIFMNAGFFADDYLENTDVTVLDGNTPGSTIVAQFQTDGQGRFAIDPLPPGIYYFEFEVFGDWPEEHLEEVEIQGQYQDFNFYYHVQAFKPNIYLYPEETTELDVAIVFPHGGRVIASDPEYGDGWHVTVEPNGIIDGRYEFLFYESLQPDYGQYEAGWVVTQEQLESFFRNNMALTAFNQKEIDDFIEYWIPLLTEYPYYAIYPQYKDELEEMARLRFSTQPASLIRLIYSVRGLKTDNLSLQEPVIPPFSREGFTVAEWGVILK